MTFVTFALPTGDETGRALVRCVAAYRLDAH
jgi:hypothetical protein